jgi:pyrroline-5-carboxylate reductase
LGAMRLGFVGAGNMAGGLARGWAASRGEPGAPQAMLFSDADHERAEALADEVGGEAVEGNLALADTSDMVILAVKPKDLDEVAPDLVQAGTPVISILAGTPLKTLHEAAPGIDWIRVMPNLGAQVREAVLCVAYGHSVDEAERKRVADMLGLVGEVIELEEGLIDAATAIMGCTPGYLALIAEILVEAGVKEGLTEEQARRMAAKAMSATGKLLELREPGELKRAVASPGGMTEAGLNELEEHNLREALQAAVTASLEIARR